MPRELSVFPKCRVPQSTVIDQSGVTHAFLSTALPRYLGLESPLPELMGRGF